VGQHDVEKVRRLSKRPRYETATDTRIASFAKLVLDPFSIAVAPTDEAQPAGIRNGSRQRAS
jgi:hypothetical protein